LSFTDHSDTDAEGDLDLARIKRGGATQNFHGSWSFFGVYFIFFRRVFY
jgi:hypothetical protein